MKHLITRVCVLFGMIFWLGLPGTASADYLGGVTFDKDSHSFLPHGELVNISIDYKVDNPEGALIYARPYTLGSPTFGYSASPSPVLPMGTGTATQYFTINSGESVVTHLRITMKSPDQTETYLELFVPVHFVFGPHGIYNLHMDYDEYSRLPYERNLNIYFDYQADWGGNVRIFARPFTDGVLTPGYGASGSASLPPSGSYDQHFLFYGDADVTDIRFEIYNDDQTQMLYQIFVPYDIHWRETGLYNISFDWPDGENLHNNQHLTATFTLEHQSSEDRHAWAQCTTNGTYTPGSYYQGSVPIPAGPQVVTRYCFVGDGEQPVDGIRLIYGSPSEQLMVFIKPADYHYAPHAVQNHVFSPASPAILSNGEHLNMTFDYVTDHGDDVLIFSRPAFDGDLMYGVSSSGSLHHPPPNGTGSYWVTFAEGDHLASSMFYHMTNVDQSEVLLEHFTHGWWAWGATSTITPAGDAVPTVPVELGAAYPNPFNPVTNIPVTLNVDTHVQLSIYDLRGRLVDRLQDGHLEAGRHLFTFTGEQQPSGVYFYRVVTPSGIQSRPMMLIK